MKHKKALMIVRSSFDVDLARPGPALLKSLHEIGILIMFRDLFMRQLN